jgi:hypothetical protein
MTLLAAVQYGVVGPSRPFDALQQFGRFRRRSRHDFLQEKLTGSVENEPIRAMGD